MRTVLIGAMLALAVAGARAEEKHAVTAPQVTVYLQGQQIADLTLLNRARTLAAGIFAEIGIRLSWRAGRPRRDRSLAAPGTVVEVRLAMEASPAPNQAAPAYALPYAPAGTQATVFYDRAVPPEGDMGEGATFLAHLLAHEIGHVLQRIARHSPAGVMKAHWDRQDQAEMKNSPLHFTPFDAELIHSALVTNGK